MFFLFAAGCSPKPATPTSAPTPGTAPVSKPPSAAGPQRAITLATTTSTQDSGLLDVLLPQFRIATGVDVKVVAVGSGQAMELGRRGDADVLLVHAPEIEEQFIRDGFGTHRLALMFNDFVIVGPVDDPAGIKGGKSAVEALRKLAAAKAKVVSRADKSGTHTKELSLWKLAEIDPQGDWYLKAGSGMAETLRIADEKAAYTLTDRASYLAQRSKLSLVVAVAGEELLRNHYSVMQLNPAKHPQLNHEGAEKLIAFLFSPEAQKLIAEFGQDKFGQPLFTLAQWAGVKNIDSAVVILDYRGGQVRRQSAEPMLTIWADGTVVVGAPFAGMLNRRVEGEITAEEVQEVVDFAVRESDFFAFDHRQVEDAVAADPPLRGGRAATDGSTTVIRIRAGDRVGEVQYRSLQLDAEQYSQIKPLVQLAAIERRVKHVMLTAQAGGTRFVNTALRLANDELQRQFPNAVPLRADDLMIVLHKPNFTEISFERRGEKIDQVHDASTWARVEVPAEGEMKVAVGSSEK